jgi:hypothetical protein
MTHDEYLHLRKSIEFCLKIQSTIDSLRSLRNSNVPCSIDAISQPRHSLPDSIDELGKPKKKVHKCCQSATEE